MVRTLKAKLAAPPSKIDPVAKADQDWFDAHEGRAFRLRDPAPLEFGSRLG